MNPLMSVEKITYDNFYDDAFDNVDITDETKGAREVISWAYETYGDSIIYSCSFGAEGMILIDLIYSVKKMLRLSF